MKKFTKGCAVDVRDMSEVMFETIKRVGKGTEALKGAKFECASSDGLNFLSIDSIGEYSLRVKSTGMYLLTPTDILGEHLVKAIEEGYTPWFEGDKCPQNVDLRYDNKGNVIAYKVRKQPSIESKTLSEKVGNHNHYFKDVSHLETVDVYRVIDLFEVTNPCPQHAIKKILCCGNRVAKDAAKDTQEAIDSLKRALEMMREDDAVK